MESLLSQFDQMYIKFNHSQQTISIREQQNTQNLYHVCNQLQDYIHYIVNHAGLDVNLITGQVNEEIFHNINNPSSSLVATTPPLSSNTN
jgi:hypothetical protein